MRRRLSYSNVIATLALFVALGGTSYAAMTITSKDVRDNSLRSVDIRNNSLRSVDIKNGSLKAKDFAVGQIPAGSMWSFRGDVAEGSSSPATMPAIPGLGTTSATCTSAGAAELSVRNTSAGVGFQYVVTVTTAAGSTSSSDAVIPGGVATIAVPPSAQVVWQLGPVPAGAQGPVTTVVASNQVSGEGGATVCGVSATAFFQSSAD